MASFGGSIKLTGADEYRNTLRQITQSLRETGTELTAVTSRFDKNDNSLSTLKTKTAQMTDVLNKQKQAYATLKSSYETFSTKVSQQAQAHEKLVQTYEKEKQELERIRKEAGENSKAYQSQQAKVNDLAGAVAKSSKNMNENEIALSKMRTQLNQAETTVNKTTKEIDELGNETEEAGKKAEKSGEGYTVFKNILANLGTQAINSAINGMKKLGGAFVNVGKQALESYGEYEQLKGGVETLFKDSADTLMEYSRDAYMTAGMSANEYMSTVTSFSASLIQSLGGDTEKAVEYSDRAITDMSDNANKMGTSMEMIQNAYQGFAKQNYTMLDNLKLGYGGTKTEMERLIKDASKMTDVQKELNVSVKDGDMSFGNIVNAISVMQKEMGIAGTTAKEAGTTIQGSVNSMKSAWTNLVTGIADGNANIEDLVRNLMITIVGNGTENNLGLLGNVMPAIERISNGIMEALPLILNGIIAVMPQFLDAGLNIINGLVAGIQQNMPAIMDATTQILNTLTTTLITNLPTLLQMGIQLIISLVQGITQQLPTLIPQMIDAVLLMVDTLLDNIDLIVDTGIQLIIGLAEGLIEALPQLIEKIPIIIDKLVTAIVNNLPKIVEMGITLIVKLAEGLIKAIPQLVSKVPQIIGSLINGIVSYYGNLFQIGGQLLGKVKDGITSGITGMLDVGKNIVTGLWNGINNAKDWVLNKIKGFGSAILDGIKGIFGIHSPSTVFRDQIGKNLALGIGEGFEDEMKVVTNEMQNAIPTSFDTNLNVGNSTSTGSSNYFNLVDAFMEALEKVKIELDDENVGRFVRKEVANAIFN